jgi:hypothetical protein
MGGNALAIWERLIEEMLFPSKLIGTNHGCGFSDEAVLQRRMKVLSI